MQRVYADRLGDMAARAWCDTSSRELLGVSGGGGAGGAKAKAMAGPLRWGYTPNPSSDRPIRDAYARERSKWGRGIGSALLASGGAGGGRGGAPVYREIRSNVACTRVDLEDAAEKHQRATFAGRATFTAPGAAARPSSPF